MSKERLEEIKDKYMDAEYDFNLNKHDINWLIEQAERVQELEFRNEITENRNYKLEQTFKDYQQVNKNMYDMIGDLKIKNLKTEQQNKRYREAIENVLEIENYGVAADYIKTVTNILLEALEEHK